MQYCDQYCDEYVVVLITNFWCIYLQSISSMRITYATALYLIIHSINRDSVVASHENIFSLLQDFPGTDRKYWDPNHSSFHMNSYIAYDIGYSVLLP